MPVPAAIYSHVQPDVATLTTGGVFYRCCVYRDVQNNSIESVLHIQYPQGGEVELARIRVAVFSTLPNIVDSPKILASGSHFVVHWFDGRASNVPDLHRAYLDMANIGTTATWTDVGSSSTHDSWLYDVQPIIDGSGAYVVVDHQNATTVRIRRYDNPTDAWGSAAWTATRTRSIINVLAVNADDTDDSVMVTYEVSATLYTLRLNASDGTSQVEAQTFNNHTATEYLQVGLARYATDDVVVLAEARDTAADEAIRFLAMVRVDSSNAAPVTNEHQTWNLQLLSRPWPYAGARDDGTQPNVYAMVAFAETTEFTQNYAFVVNLDAREWTSGGTDNTIRPRVMVNINEGNIDARPSGETPSTTLGDPDANGRRMNHISNAAGASATGVALKTRTVALVTFGRLFKTVTDAIRRGLAPMGAGITAHEVHLEEPWAVHRDATDPAQPTEQFYAPYRQQNFEHIQLGNSLMFGGGCPSLYDGKQVVEVGYHWYPQILSTALVAAAGGPVVGTRRWTATYSWRDNQGRLHRSSPATPAERESTINGQGIDVEVRTMTMSQRINDHHYHAPSLMSIELWRTEAGGFIFYRLYGTSDNASSGHYGNTPENDPTTYAVTQRDTVSDTQLVEHEILPYALQDGGLWAPLVPIQPPQAQAMALWKGRVWLASGYNLWYSRTPGPEPGGVLDLPPEFNPTLQFALSTYGGEVVAMSPMDDALVVFTDNQIYSVTGEPADDTGANPTLRVQVLSQDTGCIEPRSVVFGPTGVFFQSNKGYYQLTRTFQLDYVGNDVEDDVQQANIRGASLLADRSQIRLVTNDAVAGSPRVLAYDYVRRLWSKHSLPLADQPGGSDWLSSAASGTTWRGTASGELHVVAQQGAVLVERGTDDANLYADEDRNSTESIPIDVTLDWVRLRGIAGYKRIRRVIVHTNRPQGSAITVRLDYEVDGQFNSDDTEDFSFLASTTVQHLDCRPRIQKMTAIRVRVFESSPVALTENVQINAVVLEVGMLRGPRRIPDSQVGT